jgi:phenylacetate-CoA ligase
VSVVEELDRFLVGRLAFPAVNYLLNRKNILSRYRKLLISEQYSKDALRELQFQKLIALLRHASTWIPFYARRFKEIGLVPEDIKTLDDIRRIPPLERQDVIEHRLDMVDVRYRDSVLAADRAVQAPGLPSLFSRFRRHRLVRNTSTGSTGTPTVFYEDGSTTALNWALELRLKDWYGLAPGVKEARMSGIATDYASNSVGRLAREYVWNQMMLPGTFLSDHEYQLCVRKIRRFRPLVLWGSTPGLTGLARYIQRLNQDINPCRLDLVISRAAPLYEHEKRLLNEVFRCPATNIYSSREVGHVAMICPHGSMHVNQENYIVETEEMDAGRASAGPGEILITPLNESPMPFIRYRIGDLAELGGSVCPCSRNLDVLKNILGRTGEVFKTRDGRLIEPSFWCLTFMVGRQSQDVERFQVVYRSNDRILFRIVPRPSYSAETEAELRARMAENFPFGMQFEFEYVSGIKPQPSGKYVIVVNEIDKQEQRLTHV